MIILPEHLKSRRILVVDDDPSIAKLVKTVLKRAGYEYVYAIGGGFELLDVFGLPHPHIVNGTDGTVTQKRIDLDGVELPDDADLVLLDIMLPNMNGFELCKILKNTFGNRLGVMLVTGFDFESHHARFIESGADDFLSKPINPTELIHRVYLLLCRLYQRELSTKAEKEKEYGSVDVCTLKNISEYQIVRTLSLSGSVAVFLVTKNGNYFVLKMLTRQAMEYPEVVTRFHREQKIQSSFTHPNIIKLLDSGTAYGMDYYVMEYVEGTNLEQFCIDSSGPLEIPFVMHIAEAVASALAHIHDKGVIHRDIKLKNIFLSRTGEVKIGDFGIALAMGDLRLTQTGYAIGTPVYMAPEQFEGKYVTPSADIYAFGATLYHLITGRPPFTATNAMELLRKHLQEKPKLCSEFRPDIPPELDHLIVHQCLAKLPKDRPRNMHEVLSKLREITVSISMKKKEEKS